MGRISITNKAALRSVLEARLAKHGNSIQKLATELGLQHETLRKVLKQNGGLSEGNLRNVCKTLKLNYDEIAFRPGQEPPPIAVSVGILFCPNPHCDGARFIHNGTQLLIAPTQFEGAPGAECPFCREMGASTGLEECGHLFQPTSPTCEDCGRPWISVPDCYLPKNNGLPKASVIEVIGLCRTFNEQRKANYDARMTIHTT